MESIAIIGAGIAGLSAGVYARRNGYDVTIYESHFLPGGMCTAWRRKGYTFEGCLHYVQLVGASPPHTYYGLWTELGVVPKTQVIRHDVFHTFRDASGRTLDLYSDAHKLETELISLSPSDALEINSLCKAIRRCSWLLRDAGKNPFHLAAKAISALGAIRALKKYGDMDLAEYSALYSDPLIRSAFSHLFVYSDFTYAQLVFFLAGLHIGGAGYPQGGSLGLARCIERTYLDLGGRLEYRSTVDRIEVEDDRATGIVLADGTRQAADIVISAADGRSTLVDMLADKYTTSALRERYATQPLYYPFVQVSLGVDRDLSGTPHVVKARTPAPFQVAGVTRSELWYQHFAYDPTVAPPGKTTLTVLYPSELGQWEHLEYQGETYRVEKACILEETISQLEGFFPGISSQVEVADVATPYTMRRYTHNWRGAIGFVMTKMLAGEMTRNTQYTLPGLDRFYMIGQWVKGFGVPMAAASGKEAIEQLCEADGQSFVAA
jgi:phytoene dehydrogenase-like protein